jgi:hypothetical protein
MCIAFKQDAKKQFILTAYLSTNHWIAVAIILKEQKLYYHDSLKRVKTATNRFKQVTNEYVISLLTCGCSSTNYAEYIN